MILVLLALAIAPGLAIVMFIYERDKLDREPFHLLIKSFFLGVLSVFFAMLLESAAEQMGLVVSDSIWVSALFALVVGISEEGTKYAFLLGFAYPKKEFNEPFDGITYAVMIAMGFATFENIIYVIDGGIQIGLLRMFSAVPAHGIFAILMGYFVGMAKFKHQHFFSPLRIAGLGTAVLFHAAYDFCLFMSNIPFLILGSFFSLALGVILSLRAIHLHNRNSPFHKEIDRSLNNPTADVLFPTTARIKLRNTIPSAQASMFKRILLKIYLVWAVFNFTVIMTATMPFIILPLVVLGEKRGGNISYFFLKSWGFLFGLCSGIRFKTVNKQSIPQNQPFVYISNHNSYLDSPAFVLAIPGQFRPLGKVEMKKIPIFGWVYPYVVVMVDRSSLESKRKSMLTLMQKLKDGISIFIFPEGKMNQSSEPMLPFHDGAFRIAVETQMPIMPMVILNSRYIMPRHEFQPRPGTITTRFLSPVPTEGLTIQDIPQLKAQVYDMMKQAIEQSGREVSEKSGLRIPVKHI
jgi:1-acyl-sn-glycerol-3-phosphate acyltransferase